MRLQRGAALITAMLVAALAAAVVATLASAQAQWLRTVELRRDQVQAQALVLAGLNWARQAIRDDARGLPVDHLGEPWALPLPPTPLENGSIEGAIVDAQGLINLNNLAGEEAMGRAERARATRLFAERGLSPRGIEAIADWIDEDRDPRDGGGEDAAYAGERPARLPPNAPMLRAAEVADVVGVGERGYSAIARFVTALPARSPLNVNTAPPDVLATAVNGVSPESLASLVAERARKPFTTVAEFRARLPAGTSIADDAGLGVRSDYFLVTVRARQGETLAQGRALLKRREGDMPAVVWQTVE
jgi:general secretion pathway protein K